MTGDIEQCGACGGKNRHEPWCVAGEHGAFKRAKALVDETRGPTDAEIDALLASFGWMRGDEQYRKCIRAALSKWGSAPAERVEDNPAGALEWAVSRWNAEVRNRPLKNVHRRSLDDTWRQVIRHFGGDPVAYCGPNHDDLVNGYPSASPTIGGPDYSAMDAAEMLSEVGDDAYKWADAFMQITANYDHLPDHGDMIGWFANAIEHADATRRWRREKSERQVEPRASEVTDGNLQEAVEIYIQGIRRNESVQSFVTRIANAAKFGGRS